MDNAHDFFQQSQYNSDAKTNDAHFVIEDLLDLPNDDSMLVVAQGSSGGCADASVAGAPPSTAAENASLTAEPSYSHTGSFMDSELCVPYDDLAELEWHIAEDSFSNDEFQKLQLIQGLKSSSSSSSSLASYDPSTHLYHFRPDPTRQPNPVLSPEVSVPAKARSKRSRAASGNWTSRLLAVLPDVIVPKSLTSSEQSESAVVVRKPDASSKTKKIPENSEGRRCLHCSTEKTPQWRTGPMGPKTLCNACGVRYKSGRLVPEYRPAASPTFVLTKHSNSHRKVLELRRQKEMIRVQQQQQFLQHQNMMFDHHHHQLHHGEDYVIHSQIDNARSYGHMI